MVQSPKCAGQNASIGIYGIPLPLLPQHIFQQMERDSYRQRTINDCSLWETIKRCTAQLITEDVKQSQFSINSWRSLRNETPGDTPVHLAMAAVHLLTQNANAIEAAAVALELNWNWSCQVKQRNTSPNESYKKTCETERERAGDQDDGDSVHCWPTPLIIHKSRTRNSSEFVARE